MRAYDIGPRQLPYHVRKNTSRASINHQLRNTTTTHRLLGLPGDSPSTSRPNHHSFNSIQCSKPKLRKGGVKKMLSSLSGLSMRQQLTQLLNFALVLSTAFMLWKGLSVLSDSPSPIVVVLSGSMEPAFQRGDLLFLWNRNQDTQVGEIVVYNVKGKDIPIVHRVIRRFGGG